AERQHQQQITERIAAIEHAQFAMLGEGLIGAGKAVVNFIPQALNGTLSMARTGLGLYGALNGGPLDLLNDPAVASIPTPQLPTLGYANAAQAGAGGAATTLLNVASLVGPVAFEAPRLVTAYDAAAAWLSDVAETVNSGVNASADLNAQAALRASVPDGAGTAPVTIPDAAPSVASPENISASKLASFTNPAFSEVSPGLYYQAQRFGQTGTGEFFSSMQPLDSMDAEELFNIKAWGNNAEQLGIFEVQPGLQAWQGGVNGGAGTQIYIPKDLQGQFIQQVGTQPLYTNELKWITRP
ncbi:MAG: hypothetical protein KGL63_10425, partial [Betaproteobacteria bacterium]|nr:hypothetical protein [Betaproteobacteria bacterium]